MDGMTLAKICDDECRARGISKAQFYKDIGLSAPSFHGWKNGAKPSQRYITAIEKYLGIDLSDYEKSNSDVVKLCEKGPKMVLWKPNFVLHLKFLKYRI